MRGSRVAVLILAGTALVGLSACNTLRGAAGMNRVTPDEFRVVSIAPLTVPPDYALRPPTPGEPRPQELDPTSTARDILLGAREGAVRSPAEQALVNAAGGDQADPLARFVVDDEFGDLAHKDESWAQRLMFWRSGDAASQTATTTAGNLVIDAAREQERLQALTGGQAIVIQRSDSGFKLPGL
ncbi:DUF3035 domain-containing protein [Brevundimonas aveniformis]|uniref:DUF3035 domain-containing protein n=1 Tax=Brevundimonas aveniformis TaxID=370977 RepID=UPI0003F6807F|nr:DUF3035 domain-containing protein [Brevundimonas aveniformis]